MILLIVAHFAMTIAAQQGHRLIAPVIGNVMLFDGAPIAFPAHPAIAPLHFAARHHQHFALALIGNFPEAPAPFSQCVIFQEAAKAFRRNASLFGRAALIAELAQEFQGGF